MQRNDDEFEKALIFFKNKINGQEIDDYGFVHIVLDITEECFLKHFTNVKIKHKCGIRDFKPEFTGAGRNLRIHADTFVNFYLNYYENKNISKPVAESQPFTLGVPSPAPTHFETTYSSTHQAYYPQFQQVPVSYTQTFDDISTNIPSHYNNVYQTQNFYDFVQLTIPYYQHPVNDQNYYAQSYNTHTSAHFNPYIQNTAYSSQQETTPNNDNDVYQTHSDNNNSSAISFSNYQTYIPYQNGNAQTYGFHTSLDTNNNFGSTPVMQEKSSSVEEPSSQFDKNEDLQKIIQHIRKRISLLKQAPAKDAKTVTLRIRMEKEKLFDTLLNSSKSSCILEFKKCSAIIISTIDLPLFEKYEQEFVTHHDNNINENTVSSKKRNKRKNRHIKTNETSANPDELQSLITYLRKKIDEKKARDSAKPDPNVVLIYATDKKIQWVRDIIGNQKSLKKNLGIWKLYSKGNSRHEIIIYLPTFEQYEKTQASLIHQSSATFDAGNNNETNLEPSAVEEAISSLIVDQAETLSYDPQIYPFANEPKFSSFQGSLVHHFHDGIDFQNNAAEQNDNFVEIKI